MTKKIAIYTSGQSRGSNFIAIYDYIKKNELPVEIAYLFTIFSDAPVVALAKERTVKVVCFDNALSLNDTLIELHQRTPVDLIVLCGFMRKLNAAFFENVGVKVLNIHPALLPKYGGKGMFGINVHKAVFAAKENISGATIHYVNEAYDAGDIIYQETCDISDCTSAEEIGTRILKIEHKIYPKYIMKILSP